MVIQGILFDEKSSFLQGPALAPPLIRETLHNGASNYFTELGVNIESQKIVDKGDFEIEQYLDITEITKQNLEGDGSLLTLGGDHSITYPILKAFYKMYGPMDILHFDAHSDLYDNFEGDPHSHACPFARIMEDGLAANLVQVGIRALNDHQRQQIEQFKVQVFEMTQPLPQNTPTFSNPLYLSLDMDVFDPAHAPGVSHHEPGGMTVRQVLQLIQQLPVPIIGADIVEFNPNRDVAGITAALAAKMMRELLGKMLTN